MSKWYNEQLGIINDPIFEEKYGRIEVKLYNGSLFTGKMLSDYLFVFETESAITGIIKQHYIERVDNPEPTEWLNRYLREYKLKRVTNG